VSVGPNESVAHAIQLLSSHRIGALLVSSESNSVEGMLSERDIVRSMASAEQDTSSLRVKQLMTADVHTCSINSSVADVMTLMTSENIRHVPVMDKGQLSGMVSIRDVVSARVNELESERQHIQEYITG